MGLDWWVKLLIVGTVGLFLTVCYLWKKPVTDFGRISLRLCFVNSVGWLILLLLPERGHPPPYLFPLIGFWLLNFILLPAVAVVLWMCRRDHQERKSYLAIALTYVGLNVLMLDVVPVVGLALLGSHR
jgi:hypothetical protein